MTGKPVLETNLCKNVVANTFNFAKQEVLVFCICIIWRQAKCV